MFAAFAPLFGGSGEHGGPSLQMQQVTQLTNDASFQDQRTLVNARQCAYLLQPHGGRSLAQAQQLAVTAPGMMISGPVQGGNIAVSSMLTLGQVQTHPAGALMLYQRPFRTTPYLGRGAVDPVVESQLRQGQSVSARRTETLLQETNLGRFRTTPLLPSKQETLVDQRHSVHVEQLPRGGLPTRRKQGAADAR